MNPLSLATADLDGDDKLDAAVANRGGASITVFRNGGNGRHASAATYPVTGPGCLAVGGRDGDKKPDLAASSGQSITVLRWRTQLRRRRSDNWTTGNREPGAGRESWCWPDAHRSGELGRATSTERAPLGA